MKTYLYPESSKLFTPWKDPQSGVTSYILTARCAPWQQAFYFTNANISADGRYLWLYCSNPPTPSHILGVVDLKKQSLQVFPETGFQAESPFIDPQNGDAYWTSAESVYCRGPEPDDRTVEIGRVPAELFGERLIRQISTHLTLSADGLWFNLNINTGDRWHIGAMEKTSGKFHLWQTFDEHVNHGQFNPTRPGLLMFAHDWWRDLNNGQRYPWKNRIWLARAGEPAYPLFPASSGQHVLRHCHEWWSKDGSRVWFVDYDQGTEYFDLDTGEHVNAWPGGTCHSHSSTDDQLVVGDINNYLAKPDLPIRVAFYNRKTGRETNLVTAFPKREAPRSYHPDPHPQFILNDEFIAYTTWVRGPLDFALVRVADLM